MKTVTLQDFAKMAAEAANRNELPLTKDGRGYYVSFILWEEGRTICHVCYYCEKESYGGEGETPAMAINNAIDKYFAEIGPVQLAAEINA